MATPNNFRRYLKLKTSDLLFSIESTATARDGVSRTSSWRVPALAVIRDIVPDHFKGTDNVVSCQFVPRDEPHAFKTLVLLLSGSLTELEEIPKRRRLGQLLSSSSSILSNLARTWAVLRTNVVNTQTVFGFCAGAILRCLRNLLHFLVVTATTSKNVSKASLLLYQIMSFVLVWRVSAPDSSLETEVWQTLSEILSLAGQSMSIMQMLKEILLPKLLEIVNAPGHFADLSRELQVRASLPHQPLIC